MYRKIQIVTRRFRMQNSGNPISILYPENFGPFGEIPFSVRSRISMTLLSCVMSFEQSSETVRECDSTQVLCFSQVSSIH